MFGFEPQTLDQISHVILKWRNNTKRIYPTSCFKEVKEKVKEQKLGTSGAREQRITWKRFRLGLTEN